MLPYLATFWSSIAILAIIQGWSRKSVGFKFWLLVSMMLPCLLAGFRATSIGTDVTGYAEPLFDVARSCDTFTTFYNTDWLRLSTWKYTSAADFEIGYVVLVWVASRVFSTVQGLLFLTQLLVAIALYWTLLRSECDEALPCGVCVYLFMYFNQSLNLMRQWIAVAFVLLGVVGLYSSAQGAKGVLRSAISILFGTLFHTSALLGMLVLAMRLYLDADENKLKNRVVIVCMAATAAFILLQPIAILLSSLGFGRYVAGYLGNQAVHLMPNQIILRLPMLVVAVWVLTRDGGKRPLSAFLFCASFIAVLFSQFTSLGEQSGRIGLYFDVFNIALLPFLLDSFEHTDARKTLIGLILIVYCLIYWTYFYVFLGNNETVPYLAFWS